MLQLILKSSIGSVSSSTKKSRHAGDAKFTRSRDVDRTWDRRYAFTLGILTIKRHH
jgi:hypothetical protein